MMRLGSIFERLRNACNRSIIISASSAIPYAGGISHAKKTQELVAYLLLTLLEAQTGWELHEILVNASDDTSDRWRSCNAGRSWMGDVNPYQHCRLAREPRERIPTEAVVYPPELGVDLERDVGEVLVLSFLLHCLFEKQALGAHSELDRTHSLYAWVDEVVPLLKQDENEGYSFGVPETLDRLFDETERPSPPRILSEWR